MTPIEAVSLFNKLAKEIGHKADLFVTLGREHEKALMLSCYPNGIGRDALFRVDADDFETLFSIAQEKWAELSQVQRQRSIRKMALEIIRITAEMGECSDAALRAEHFSAEDLARYGADAVADANEIANNGPFTIVSGASANAA